MMQILVIEPDPQRCQQLAGLLNQLEYRSVTTVGSWQQAVTLVPSISVDAVIAQQQALSSAARQVGELKRQAGSSFLPVLMLVDSDEEERQLAAFNAGADDILPWPLAPVVLEARLKAQLRTRTLSQALDSKNKELMGHRANIDREHAIVEHIFANALEINSDAQQLIDFHLAPASNFNGDLFLCNTSYLGTLYFLIGDFTGHGLASAIGALPTAKAFMTTSAKAIPVEEIAATINSTLRQLLPGDMFFACIIGEIDHSGTRMRIWNGGMPPLLLMSEEGEVRKEFHAQHMSLGILEPNEFERDVMQYTANEGDRLIGYTDGLIEVRNPVGRMLGQEGLTRWLQQEPDIHIGKLVTRLEIFRGPGEQLDDITLFSFQCGQLPAEKARIVPLLPWTLSLQVEDDDIRRTNPVTNLIEHLATQRGLHRHSGYLFTILSELYSNALEHGLLELDSSLKDTDSGFAQYYQLREQRLAALRSGKISIKLDFDPKQKRILIQIEDSGKGFKQHKQVGQIEALNAPYGRGIELLRHLSGKVEYADAGTKVTVVYNLDD